MAKRAKPDDRMPRQRYTLYLDADLRAAIAAIKARDGVPESVQIRRALRAWVEEREGAPGRRSRTRGK
jgi:hypothetical protein